MNSAPHNSASTAQLLGERIFSVTDLNFIEREAPLLRSKLLKERRTTALIWVREMRRVAQELMRAHSAAARLDASARPVQELKLAAMYLAYLAWCRIAELLIICRGPFAARRAIIPLISATEQLAALQVPSGFANFASGPGRTAGTTER
jgi:hypothetical protein